MPTAIRNPADLTAARSGAYEIGQTYNFQLPGVSAETNRVLSEKLTKYQSFCGCSSGTAGVAIAGIERAAAATSGSTVIAALPSFSWVSAALLIVVGAAIGKASGLMVKQMGVRSVCRQATELMRYHRPAANFAARRPAMLGGGSAAMALIDPTPAAVKARRPTGQKPRGDRHLV